ncbi:MAG: dTMP kinase [Leptolyngbya sp. LCM1.Bin17]|nr:MAG: dTMP kinase [Leptolyngbya sp. LCM1.Bin17]
MQGKLIVFEGVEGCGKSTQLQALAKRLTAPEGGITTPEHPDGVPVITTREPGGTPLGGELRQLLLGQAMASPTELLLYAADRAQHVEEVIRPALAAGHWVLCDRFIDSTVAYQGYGRGLDLGLIQRLNQVATGGLTPDLTLWLQLDAATGLSRTRQRGAADRIEQADLAFHQRVQQGFETLAQQYPERIVPIDAAQPPAAVATAIFTVVEQHLQPWPNRLQT